jgi:hypothetical protein
MGVLSPSSRSTGVMIALSLLNPSAGICTSSEIFQRKVSTTTFAAFLSLRTELTEWCDRLIARRSWNGGLHDHGLNITCDTHITVTAIGLFPLDLAAMVFLSLFPVALSDTVASLFPADIVVAEMVSGSSMVFEILGGL